MRLILALFAGLLLAAPAQAQQPTRTYALSLIGKPALPEGFDHFPYVNPDAPKGGSLSQGVIGSFDNYNAFIVRGSPAAGTQYLYDTLTVPSANEPYTAYGRLAKTIEVAPDRMWVAFELRPEARFNDGTPVTAADVVWTFNTLRTKGAPFYAQYYADVANAVAESPTRVVFHFKSNKNRELPQILGEMQVMPEHWWKGRDFSKPLTDPPLGSGPYRIGHADFGRTMSYERVKDWWARDLPTARGMYNFDTLRFEYFRDASVAFAAFKAGLVDYRLENISKNWATGYAFPARAKGLVKLENVPDRLPTGMEGFAMNTRRAVFKDPLVRRALTWALDFQWMNKTLFYGAYTRNDSYFSNSDFASSGIPQGDELALLQPFKDKLPPELFTKPFMLPVTDGSGNNRTELKQSLAWLKQAGWTVHDRKLVNAQGEQMSFVILLSDPSFERVALPYVETLSRLGIAATVRTVDPAQYVRLMQDYDYDMTTVVLGESDSPGNEQTGLWTCGAASKPGGQNYMGVCNPVVDALVADVIAAKDVEHLQAATRALDRVLLWNWYVVPQWYIKDLRIAYWNKFARPAMPIEVGTTVDDWWVDPKLAAVVDAARKGGP